MGTWGVGELVGSGMGVLVGSRISQVAARPFDAVAEDALTHSGDCWAASHKDELTFQEAKQTKHRLEGVQDGHIVNAGEEERLAAEQLEKQKCLNDVDRKKKAAKIAAALKPKAPLDISGKAVFSRAELLTWWRPMQSG